jgi:hypothetical protein
MNKFKNKWIFIIAILVVILAIIIFSNKDGISKLIGVNKKDVFESKSNTENICKKKSYYLGVYLYNDTVSSGTDGYCVTGKENTCIETDCYKDKSVGACSAGTIIHYYVKSNDNDAIDKYFNVLHDDGDTMTLQSVDAITQSAWNESGKLTQGPITALAAIEDTTKNWTNVNQLNYCLGNKCTQFLKYPNLSYTQNDYTGFDNDALTSTNGGAYTYGSTNVISRSGYARIVSFQELVDLGCRYRSSCPSFLYNNNEEYYYTLGAYTGNSHSAWLVSTIDYKGLVYAVNNSEYFINTKHDLHAVVEINK